MPASLITSDHAAATRWPVFHADAEEAVLRILRDGNVSTHPVIRELEADYAAFAGRRHAIAHNNGTSALLAAFHALDLAPGDEVLVPSATFWASVLPMVWCGLVPVFCESEPGTLGIDPEDMRRRITSRTRAVVIVHLWGLPCRVDEIRRVCEDHGARHPAGIRLPDYVRLSLPVTERENKRLIKLPAFTQPDTGLLEQYRAAFEKVAGLVCIAAVFKRPRFQTSAP